MDLSGKGAVADLSKLQKLLDKSYRDSYLEGHVKGSIAYQIQALREKEGLTQTEFGKLIGKPQSVVSRLEDTEYGGVNVNTLLQIAYALNIGLEVRFCDFRTILKSDVSPDGLKVENIYETINNIQNIKVASTETLTQAAVALTAIVAKNWSTVALEGVPTWPINLPNQPPISYSPGSGTHNFAMFTPMQAPQV
jgi:transcriptional regulator with XRE-family HTH domain